MKNNKKLNIVEQRSKIYGKRILRITNALKKANEYPNRLTFNYNKFIFLIQSQFDVHIKTAKRYAKIVLNDLGLSKSNFPKKSSFGGIEF